MRVISIATGYTDETVNEFKKTFERLGLTKKDLLFARIFYNVNRLTSYDQNPLTFPLVIRTKEYAFCLADCNAGYGGTGPHGTVEVLKYLGFNFFENDIYMHRDNGITNLKYEAPHRHSA